MLLAALGSCASGSVAALAIDACILNGTSANVSAYACAPLNASGDAGSARANENAFQASRAEQSVSWLALPARARHPSVILAPDSSQFLGTSVLARTCLRLVVRLDDYI